MRSNEPRSISIRANANGSMSHLRAPVRAPPGCVRYTGIPSTVSCAGTLFRSLRDNGDRKSCFSEITRQLARVRLDATHEWMVEGAQEQVFSGATARHAPIIPQVLQ